MVLIPLEHTLTITVPLPGVLALPHPLWGARERSSVALRRSNLINQLNSGHGLYCLGPRIVEVAAVKGREVHVSSHAFPIIVV
ncbi:hypothetical protein EV424DRAFT_1392180 [Suillus variegatus]|nr:hypothetical protein EV424DRAFT_1392180 [Suillus variegatus]